MMARIRVAARLARREVQRRQGRTLLVVLLVAIPVAGMTIAAVVRETVALTPRESYRIWFGSSDMAVEGIGGPVALPPGSRAVTFDRGSGETSLRTDTNAVTFASLSDLPMTDPLADGIMRIIDGRAAARPGEVFVTKPVANLLHVHAGDDLRLVQPARVTLHVVGVGEWRALHDDPLVVLGPGTDGRPLGFRRPLSNPVELVDLPPGAVPVSSPDHYIATPNKHVDMSTGVAQSGWIWLFGATAFAVFGIVIASAFAVGARRQTRTIGLLSANGAPQQVVRSTLFMQGTWTGIVGTALGLVLGALGLVASRGIVVSHSDYDIHPWHVPVLALAGIALLGVATSTVAALVPSYTTSRIPVLAALAGHQPAGRAPRRLPWWGFVAVVGGLVMLAFSSTHDVTTGGRLTAAICGVFGVIFGFCAIAPNAVALLDVFARRLHGRWRLATRSLARQRTRTAAVVCAVMATGALAIGASAAVGAVRDHSPVRERPDLVLAAHENGLGAELFGDIRGVVPDARVLTVPILPSFEYDRALATPDALALYGLGANARAALDRKGEVVVSARLTGKGNPPKVGASRYDDRLPAVLVSPARAQALGLTPRSTVTAFVARRALTSQQRDAIDALRVVWIDKADVSHAQIDNAPDPAQLYALFAALALVVAILVILMSLALSAADTRDERDVLAVVGANPSTLRAVSARKAFVLAAVGAVLALPVGLLPAIVFVKAHVSYMRFAFPWLTVAVVTVGVPVGAAAAAWAGSAIALRYRPLRVSTLRYD